MDNAGKAIAIELENASRRLDVFPKKLKNGDYETPVQAMADLERRINYAFASVDKALTIGVPTMSNIAKAKTERERIAKKKETFTRFIEQRFKN